MAGTENVDVLILGSGQGGKLLAWHLARTGKRVAVFERRWVGGACPAVACMPSKNEVWSGRVAHVVYPAAPVGTTVEGARTDMRTVLARKQAMVEREIAAHLAAYGESGADHGHRPLYRVQDDRGRPERRRHADAVRGGDRHQCRHPCRGAGIPGLTDARPLTNIEALEFDRVPAHLFVLGGGYVGIEMAQAFRRFGSRVTIIEPGPHLMSREDADVAEEILGVLAGEGVEVLTSARPVKVVGLSGDTVSLTVQTGRGEETITGSDLLVATSRVANTAGIGLELTGIALDPRGFIRVNERLETDAPGIWPSASARAAPSLPMCRPTTSGSSGTTWPAETAGPTTGWCPT